MKSRTLISFCQIPSLNPSHAGLALAGTISVFPVGSAFRVVAMSYYLFRFGPRARAAGLSQSEQRGGMPGDHQFLVGRDHPRRHFALRSGDARTLAGVRLRIQHEAQPGRSLADSLADLRRVLTDAGGEDDRVHAAHG